LNVIFTSTPITFSFENMSTTIVIKDADDDAYKSLKGEAMRSCVKVGEAASSSLITADRKLHEKVRKAGSVPILDDHDDGQRP